jgi:predicted ATPase with chaperone activity
MLARRLTTILPAMTLPEAIETTRIHRVAGLTDCQNPCRRPTLSSPASALTPKAVDRYAL